MAGEPRFGDPVLGPAHDKNALDLIDMYACTIDAKACSAVMGGLAAAAPLRGALGHVKRVRKPRDAPAALDVILCPVRREDAMEEDGDDPEIAEESGAGFTAVAAAHVGDEVPLEALPPAVVDIIKGHSERAFVVQVARYPPHTKEDQAAWGRHWPVTLRPMDKIALRDAVELAPEEAAAMRRHMAAAWRLAGAGGSGGADACAGCNACVIVDPESDVEAGGRVVGTGVDGSGAHPLHHAVMRAAEAVAAWQRRTWYGESSSGEEEDEASREEEAKRRRVDGGAVSDAAAAAAAAGGDADTIPPYLCTGYDCYIVHEPCAMCAMALVHSRARRVVFCVEDPRGGALGGAGLKLHSKRTLNHHYVVYKMPLLK